MGLTDLFRRGRSSASIAPRPFVLTFTGHGISVDPMLPATIAHLSDGTIIVGPFDMTAARASNQRVKTIAIHAGTPPSGALERRAMSDTSIVTYSTAERGTTQLVCGVGVADYRELLASVAVLSPAAEWRLVADTHELVWPAGLTVRATGDHAAEHGPYELYGSTTEIVNLYGPLTGDSIPAPEVLNAVGQQRVDTGALPGVVRTVKHYTFEGETTVQRYYYVPLDANAVMLVRARTSVAAAPALFALADIVAQTLRPRS